jgi:hypothetical protein
MQVVYEAANLIDAHLVRHALEHAGIPVFIRGEALQGAIGELPACGLVAVCVPESHWAQARLVVAGLPFVAGTEVAEAGDQPWPDGLQHGVLQT